MCSIQTYNSDIQICCSTSYVANCICLIYYPFGASFEFQTMRLYWLFLFHEIYLMNYNTHICLCSISHFFLVATAKFLKTRALTNIHTHFSDKYKERSAMYEFIMVFCCIWEHLYGRQIETKHGLLHPHLKHPWAKGSVFQCSSINIFNTYQGWQE